MVLESRARATHGARGRLRRTAALLPGSVQPVSARLHRLRDVPRFRHHVPCLVESALLLQPLPAGPPPSHVVVADSARTGSHRHLPAPPRRREPVSDTRTLAFVFLIVLLA